MWRLVKSLSVALRKWSLELWLVGFYLSTQQHRGDWCGTHIQGHSLTKPDTVYDIDEWAKHCERWKALFVETGRTEALRRRKGKKKAFGGLLAS